MTIASTKNIIGQFSAEGASRIQDAVAALTSKGPRHSTDGAAVVINVGACAYDVELRSWGHGGVVDMRPAGLIRLCEHHGILI